MRKINFKKTANKMLSSQKKKARNPEGTSKGLEKNASKMSNKMTKPERLFFEMMNSLSIDCEPQKIIDKKIFDFYMPKTNTVVEIHGDYWHANPIIYEGKELNKTQLRNVKNDSFKKTLALGRGYLFEEIWEYDLNNNFEIIKERLIKLWK